MKHPIIVGCVGMFMAASLASAATAIDAQAGKGTAKAGLHYGIGSTSGLMGELFSAPGQVITDAKPGIQSLQGQLSSAIGTTATTAAPNPVDPSDANGNGDVNS